MATGLLPARTVQARWRGKSQTRPKEVHGYLRVSVIATCYSVGILAEKRKTVKNLFIVAG
jgi:hypothetical protein